MNDQSGQSVTPPVEKGSAGSPLAKPAVGPTAEQRATEFQSTAPRGKPRLDGLPPGSEAAREADRKKWRESQQERRAKLRAQSPPALPSKVGTVADAPLSPGQPVGVDEGTAFVPWHSELLSPLFEEIVPALEQEAVASLTNRAAKADLPAPILKQIEKDAHWGVATKKSLTVTAPAVAAKWLNKAGISAEYQGEVVLALAVSKIAFTHWQLCRKLDKLIKDRDAAKSPPPNAHPGTANLVQFQKEAKA